MRITHLKIQGTSQWRWLLVLPAFLLGVFAGFLIHITGYMEGSWIPFMDFQILVMRVADFLQMVVTGFCSVFFAGHVAPRSARVVKLVAATIIIVFFEGTPLLTGYYQSVPTLEVIWSIVFQGTAVLAAITAVLLRNTPPTTVEK